MLVVIVVIAILALIVVPRLMGAVRKAREASLKENLQKLRTAVAQFESDTGIFPAVLEDVAQPDAASVSAAIPANSYKGPYLRREGGIGGAGLPKNPFTSALSTSVADHWNYAAADGTVTVPDAQAAMTTLEDGLAFSEL